MKETYDCGLLIKKLREKSNMTQQELGRKINRDKGIISRYENNYQAVPFDTMRAFASIFNVSMDYLAGMEKSGCISAAGLTVVQIEILETLADMFRNNNYERRGLSPEQCEILGKILVEFFNNAN